MNVDTCAAGERDVPGQLGSSPPSLPIIMTFTETVSVTVTCHVACITFSSAPHASFSISLMMIGTVYRNYHHPALIIIFVFPGLLPKILQPSSQEHACPTWTCACLAKHYSKWPVGDPKLNLVPTAPKLHKVALHHVLVGIPTLTVS